MSNYQQCPACGGGPLQQTFVMRGFEFVACASCDLEMYRGAERVTRSDGFFAPSYFTEGGAGYPDYLADSAVRRRQARQYLQRLAALGVISLPGRRALDVGCAAGFFMVEAAAAGWDVTGCDVSDFVGAYARDVFRLDVQTADYLDAPFEPHTFDLITMFGVLEHLPAPREVANHTYELLRPGGIIAIETWNRCAPPARLLGKHWHVYAPPSCLWYHSERSLRALFSAERWRRISYGTAHKWTSVRHAISALDYMSPRLATVARRALEGPTLREASVPYPMSDLVFAVFQRI
jgi:2-polyprenyl-3-methyl-5-hydroxy-6-metoxy-1,4-benzoquinol methylase